MNANKIISKVIKEKGRIRTVFFIGCGGSMIDLYPANYMLNAEASDISSYIYTSREFVLSLPKRLGNDSLVIVCSHSGNTPESVEAAHAAKEAGAYVITITHNKDSKCTAPEFVSWVYPWGDDVKTEYVPVGISLLLAAELIEAQEGFAKHEALIKAIDQIDGVIGKARLKVNEELSNVFANSCKENPFFYVLGSGSAFSQTYGFVICSMMEMQWQNCCHIHSGEYFHGPFEVTENGLLYVIQMSSGKTREMDERALAFLRGHTDRLIVIDALEYGMDSIDSSVREYLDSSLFYAINCELRAARGKLFNHPVETRRYMDIEKY
ncbi:fructoselysine-6-P-deglycase FrlB-like protein [Ruminiclostridium sufflavum DSM 19573]|uniref:Fructoselysine-6-P-deglycase FrlB-like protein n=1 Tax=Ruminiclostridium sufflavum DSM 19573 TaxID=1121337 RepID=A0A318XH70_9FIRM|nr:SIS domain-containing protein [Ruminiclostridium sufflavum]PYG85920.1 fructoselysine-6-P-deglycase FrlB-like protein [Ruminiclostridium sufflavum DSM 19573]